MTYYRQYTEDTSYRCTIEHVDSRERYEFKSCCSDGIMEILWQLLSKNGKLQYTNEDVEIISITTCGKAESWEHLNLLNGASSREEMLENFATVHCPDVTYLILGPLRDWLMKQEGEMPVSKHSTVPLNVRK